VKIPLKVRDYIYYEEENIVILHGDCLEILPLLEPESVDLVLTDPPYLSQHLEYGKCDIGFLKIFPCKQLIFWSARDEFPLDYTAIHIWDKYCGTISVYERIFERNGKTNYKVYRGQKIQNHITAQINRDVATEHPSQKPRKVIQRLIEEYSKENDLILDPFLGSGTTTSVCKNLGRQGIGIEIEEKYCQIAVERLKQEVLAL